MPPQAANAPKTIRVLVVDDEESIRSFAARALSTAGYEVVVAEDGPSALATVEREGPFDLFVLDVVMPQMTGDELGRRLREADPDAKLLYFTGYSGRLFSEKTVLWENEAFVDKPVTVNGLIEAASLLVFGSTTRLPQPRS